MIETSTNHISSRRDIVFRSVENYAEIVRRFVISKKGSSFQITLKLRKNHDLNDCARMDISFIRLCPRPSNPDTVWKLRLSAFCMCYYSLTKIRWIWRYGTKCVNSCRIDDSPIKRYNNSSSSPQRVFICAVPPAPISKKMCIWADSPHKIGEIVCGENIYEIGKFSFSKIGVLSRRSPEEDKTQFEKREWRIRGVHT